VKCLIKADFHVIAKVGSTRWAALSATKAIAKKAFKYVGEIAKSAGAAAISLTAILESGLAITVICGTLLIVFQNVIGFADRFETRLGIGVTGIAVRMAIRR
jgi:hypothetical protein